MSGNETMKVDFWVDPEGRARDRNPWNDRGRQKLRDAENRMVEATKRMSHVPDQCSDEVLASPGRGRMLAF